MSTVQLITALEKYSIDILCLGIAVCGLTSIIKFFVPAKLKKFLTFVPFLLGYVAVVLYQYISTKALNFQDATLIKKGFECGTISTIYYVVYEQFIRGKKGVLISTNPMELAVAGEIQNVVLPNHIRPVAKEIVSGISKSLTDVSFCVSFCVDTLRNKTVAGVSESDVMAISKLIVQSLIVLSNAKIKT